MKIECNAEELGLLLKFLQRESGAVPLPAVFPAAVEAKAAPPAPVPAEAPAAAPPPPDPEKVARGRKAFKAFVETWCKGLNPVTLVPQEGVESPDRTQLLRDVHNGSDAHAILLYVQSKGGLQQALAEVTKSTKLARELAPYIVPPASIVFPDLADTYEYTNPFKEAV